MINVFSDLCEFVAKAHRTGMAANENEIALSASDLQFPKSLSIGHKLRGIEIMFMGININGITVNEILISFHFFKL